MGIARNARMYINSQKYQWMTFLTYRLQAAVWVLVFALGSLMQIISITVIYNVSSGINGWGYYQVLALSGLSSMLLGVVLYSLSPHSLARTMRNGQLDQRLVKPYNPVVFMLANSGSKASIGQFLTGIVIFAYSAFMAGVPAVTASAMFGVFLLGAAVLVMFVLMITLLSYVLLKSASYIQWITNIAGRASSYPLDVYGFTGEILLTIGLPIGLASFYPAEFLFGKLQAEWIMAVVFGEILAILVYYRISAWLLTKYTSGGG